MQRLYHHFKENKVTQLVSIGTIVIALGAVGFYSYDWNISRTATSTKVSTSQLVPEETFEDLSLSTLSMYSAAKNENNATTKQQPLLRAIPVYGIDNSLQLEKDIYRTMIQNGGSTSIKNSINSQNNTSPNTTFSSLTERHIATIRKMYAYLQINLLEYTKGNPDAAKALSTLEKELTEAQNTIQESISELESESNRLKAEYTLHETDKKSASSSYSTALTNFDGKAMEEQLQIIVKEEQAASEFYTRYKNLDKIVAIYKSFVSPITKKLLVLQANREALLKGVSVVNIPGMQEDLILTESEWRTLVGK